MATDVLTKVATEADLEARISAAIRKAFPWVPEGALRHQVRFSFSVGRARIEVDGSAREAEGRIDVLVSCDAKPLAVFELKRPGLALTRDDELQGLSYAKVMDPFYPLVVITNGDETRMLETHTGAPWTPAAYSEEEFAKLIAAAGKVAAGTLKEAISTLMGCDQRVWTQAVRAASGAHAAELTGEWDDPSRPFVRDFLFPRKATFAAARSLAEGGRFLLIHGAPLVGKSSVLRELVARSVGSAEMAILFVEADEGRGVLQAAADLLTSALSWPLTTGEARHWLRQLSHAEGPALVLAIDGIGPGHDLARRELEDLSSATFGPQLRLVVTTDDAVATRLVQSAGARQASPIGRRIDVAIDLGLLDDEEFEQAAGALWDHRMGLQHGARTASELRVPWVLRALGGHYAPSSGDPADRAVVLPAQLSLDVMAHTRERFPDPELRRLFRGLARAVLQEAEDSHRPFALQLEAMATYLVRRETLEEFVGRTDIDALMANGYLKPAIHDAGIPVLYARLPELLASEASRVIAQELPTRASADPREAARWLVGLSSRIPLGDIVAAQSFLDAANHHPGLPFAIVQALVDMPPRWNPIAAGTRAAMHLDGLGIVDVTFGPDGSFTAEVAGRTQAFAADPDEPAGLLGDCHAWMILSHLAGQRIVRRAERVDLELLGHVGSCPHVLRRPDSFMQGSGILTHRIPGYGETVCHAAGIVEPITLSLFKMLSREGRQQEEWVERALASQSLGLLARIDIALRETEKLLGPVGTWAQETRRDRISPALGEALKCAAE